MVHMVRGKTVGIRHKPVIAVFERDKNWYPGNGDITPTEGCCRRKNFDQQVSARSNNPASWHFSRHLTYLMYAFVPIKKPLLV